MKGIFIFTKLSHHFLKDLTPSHSLSSSHSSYSFQAVI